MRTAFWTLATVTGVIGAVCLWIKGADYSACHQWWVNGAQPACQDAAKFHAAGIALFIIAALLIVVGLAAGPGRQTS
jgi:hypothetical protein